MKMTLTKKTWLPLCVLLSLVLVDIVITSLGVTFWGQTERNPFLAYAMDINLFSAMGAYFGIAAIVGICLTKFRLQLVVYALSGLCLWVILYNLAILL
jgi:hypothetical protein